MKKIILFLIIISTICVIAEEIDYISLATEKPEEFAKKIKEDPKKFAELLKNNEEFLNTHHEAIEAYVKEKYEGKINIDGKLSKFDPERGIFTSDDGSTYNLKSFGKHADVRVDKKGKVHVKSPDSKQEVSIKGKEVKYENGVIKGEIEEINGVKFDNDKKLKGELTLGDNPTFNATSGVATITEIDPKSKLEITTAGGSVLIPKHLGDEMMTKGRLKFDGNNKLVISPEGMETDTIKTKPGKKVTYGKPSNSEEAAVNIDKLDGPELDEEQRKLITQKRKLHELKDARECILYNCAIGSPEFNQAKLEIDRLNNELAELGVEPQVLNADYDIQDTIDEVEEKIGEIGRKKVTFQNSGGRVKHPDGPDSDTQVDTQGRTSVVTPSQVQTNYGKLRVLQGIQEEINRQDRLRRSGSSQYNPALEAAAIAQRDKLRKKWGMPAQGMSSLTSSVNSELENLKRNGQQIETVGDGTFQLGNLKFRNENGRLKVDPDSLFGGGAPPTRITDGDDCAITTPDGGIDTSRCDGNPRVRVRPAHQPELNKPAGWNPNRGSYSQASGATRRQMQQKYPTAGEVWSDLTRVFFKGHTIQVNKKIVQPLKQVENEILAYERTNGVDYKIKTIHGYEWKNIESTSKRSFHSYGLAIDINYQENPILSSPGPHTMPQYFVDAFKRNGFYWGGDWYSVKDYMHFEYHGGNFAPNTNPVPGTLQPVGPEKPKPPITRPPVTNPRINTDAKPSGPPDFSNVIVTNYKHAKFSDTNIWSTKGQKIYDGNVACAIVNKGFYEEVKCEGWGTDDRDGKLYSYQRGYIETTKAASNPNEGYDSVSYQPHYTLATARPKHVKGNGCGFYKGTWVYLEMPRKSPWSGWYKVEDYGIRMGKDAKDGKCHVDIFVGYGQLAIDKAELEGGNHPHGGAKLWVKKRYA